MIFEILTSFFTDEREKVEIENKKIKEYFSRAQELEMTEDFFRFAYMGILKNPDEYKQFLMEDDTPIPNKLIEFFLHINKLIHKPKILREKIAMEEKESGK